MAKVKSANKLPQVSVPRAPIAEESIVTIPCNRIFADKKWNARSSFAGDSTLTTRDGEGKTKGLAGIVCSIAHDGRNNEPVVLMANPDYVAGSPASAPDRTRCEYFLVCGFQRYEAITGIANGTFDNLLGDANQGGFTPAQVMGIHTSNPVIRAVIETHSAASARKRNIEENTLRNNLTTPDLVAAVLDLKAKQPGITQADIGRSINNSQGYAGKLLAIGEGIKGVKASINGVEKPLLAHWREHSMKATVAQMVTLSALPTAAEKAKAFQEACGGTVLTSGSDGSDAGTGNGGRNKWIDGSIADIKVIATMLGHLEYAKLMSVEDNLFTEGNVETLLAPMRTLNKQAHGDEPEALAFRTKFAKAARDAFEGAAADGPLAAMAEEETSEESAEEPTLPVAAKKRSASTNGKGAHA